MKTSRDEEKIDMTTASEKRSSRISRLCAVIGTTLLVAAAVAYAAQSSRGYEIAETPPDPGNLRTFLELARSDIKTQKAYILAQNLPLTEAEGAEFWPLEREYESELSRLGDEKLSIIKDYVANYYNMSQRDAGKLAQRTFELERRKVDLKEKYFKKFSRVMETKKAARFFQIENQLNTAIDLRVAASLPLIQ